MLPERDEVVRDTLAKALTFLEQATQAATQGDDSTYSLLLWKAAAEAEYLAFQISTIHSLMDFDPASKKTLGDPEITLEAARKLLRAAESSMLSDPREAYRSIRGAIAVLRKMQLADENLSKRQAIRSPKNE